MNTQVNQVSGQVSRKTVSKELDMLFELVCPGDWYVDYVPNWENNPRADLYEYECKSDKDYHVGVLVFRDLNVVAINPDDVLKVIESFRRKIMDLNESTKNVSYMLMAKW